jgi:hypothetical protein
MLTGSVKSDPTGGGVSMNRTTTVALMVAMLGLAACDKGGAETTTTTSASGSGGGGSIGVKECDDYIAKFNSCYKDPTAKAAAQPGLDAMKQAWTAAAKDPATKAGLAASCKAALDSFPSAACK